MAAPPFLYPVPVSVAPRIHRRLPRDIRHRYSRYRPGDLHRAGDRCGPSYGSDAELAAGDLIDDIFYIYYHGAPRYLAKSSEAQKEV